MKFSDFVDISLANLPLVELSVNGVLQWKKEVLNKDVIFLASDGTIVGYAVEQLSNDNVAPYTLAYRSNSGTIQKPYSENAHLSSDAASKETYVSNIVEVNDLSCKLSTIAENAFIHCNLLSSITATNVTAINSYAFQNNSNNTSLAYVNLSNALSIGASGFFECTKLSSAYFPKVKNIGRVAFYQCTNLNDVNISSVEYFDGDQTFNNCRNITSINLPYLKVIGNLAFQDCKRLSNVYLTYQDVPPTLGLSAFKYNRSGSALLIQPFNTIWVKNETYKQYLTADNWNEISNNISSFIQPIVTFINPDTELGDNGEAIYEDVEYELVKDGEQYVNTPSTSEVQITVSNINEQQCTFQAMEEGPTVTMLRDTSKEQSKTGYRCYATTAGSRFGYAEVAIKLTETILKTEKLNYGMSAIAPIITRPYYDFKGWDKPYVDVTADVSCTAVFSKRLINSTTTTLDMSSHIVTGTSADYEHTCDEINPGVSCIVDGVLTLLSNSVDYTLSYENNKVKWNDVNVGETRTQTAQVKVTGINYYSGIVSTDFTIGYHRNGSGKFTVTFDPCGGDVPSEPQSIEYSYGDTYGLCSQFNVLDTTASRAGHTFLGWFEEGKETRVLSTDVIEKTEPYTLSAKWMADRYELSISSSSDGWEKSMDMR